MSGMMARPMSDFLMAPSGVPFTLKGDKHAPEQAHRGPGHPALGHRCSNNLGRAAEGTGQQLREGSGPHIPSIWSCPGTKSIFSHLLRETSSLTWELWTGSRVFSILSYGCSKPALPAGLPSWSARPRPVPDVGQAQDPLFMLPGFH